MCVSRLAVPLPTLSTELHPVMLWVFLEAYSATQKWTDGFVAWFLYIMYSSPASELTDDVTKSLFR